jgi:hypothetical protein
MCICFVDVFEHECLVFGELIGNASFCENRRTLLKWVLKIG